METFTDEQIAAIKELSKVEGATQIKATQKDLLQSAANTASKICEANVKLSTSKLRDSLDDDVNYKDEQSLRNNINHSNFNFCRDVEMIWNRTERAVNEGSSAKAVALIEKAEPRNWEYEPEPHASTDSVAGKIHEHFFGSTSFNHQLSSATLSNTNTVFHFRPPAHHLPQ